MRLVHTAPFQRGSRREQRAKTGAQAEAKEGPQGARMGFAGVGGLRTASRAGAAVTSRHGSAKRQLFSDAQLGDNRTIPLDVLLGQVVQHLAALTDHLQQAAAGVVVLLVDLQVLGELPESGR